MVGTKKEKIVKSLQQNKDYYNKSSTKTSKTKEEFDNNHHWKIACTAVSRVLEYHARAPFAFFFFFPHDVYASSSHNL